METTIKKILTKEKLQFKNITKATSGFTNLVYFIDDNYVIKMSNQKEIKEKLDKETSIYQNVKLEFIPQYIANGTIEGYQYLIITKLQGTSLYSIWHKLSDDERKNCVHQIAKILKEFNSQDTSFLSAEYKDYDWVNYMQSQLKEKSSVLFTLGYNIENIEKFVNSTLPQLFETNKFGLVYNDAHFDNFIYNNGKLSLIDFDRTRVCPIDYEMLIFKCMCEDPLKFASEEDEPNVKLEDYTQIYNQFQIEYPELFNIDNIDSRIAIYQFNYRMKHALNCKDHEWIKELLNKFNNIFF